MFALLMPPSDNPPSPLPALQMASGGGRPEPPRIAHAHTVGPDWPTCEASLEEGLPKAGALARAVTFSGALRGRTPSAGELVLQQPLLRPIRTHRASDGTTPAGQSAPSMPPMTAGGAVGGVGSPTKRTSLSRQGSVEMEECRICKEGREAGERMIRCAELRDKHDIQLSRSFQNLCRFLFGLVSKTTFGLE